jgi:hypothetical protein
VSETVYLGTFETIEYLEALTSERDAAHICVRCGQRPQENGNWCWDCSNLAYTGAIAWDAPPLTGQEAS